MSTSTVGLIGELKVQRILNSCKARFGIKYVSNLPLYNDRNYFQIDDVVICTRGLYALEVKNWNCEVTCDSRGYWKVKYPTHEIMVKSPIIQNRQHCEKLARITGVMPVNVVLFADEARLKNSPENVMHFSQFKEYLSDREELFDDNKVDSILSALKAYKKSIEPQMLMDFIFKRADI